MSFVTYLGPPGTGKTETLIREVEGLISSGIHHANIGYISFTKKAVDVAGERTGRPRDELRYFRTIHSLCFGLCGLSQAQVVQDVHYKQLGEKIGVELTGNLNKRGSLEDLCPGDRALSIVETARATRSDLRKTWESSEASDDVDWLLVDLVSRALAKFKEREGLVDYTGMLERYLVEGSIPPMEALVVDEAQDLSPLQWDVVGKLSKSCGSVLVAGDDDQAIYRWAGARPERFREEAMFGETRVLGKSWRIPRKVYKLAMAVVADVEGRMEKAYEPRDAEGVLDYRSSIEDVDMASGSWLVLVRNRYMVRPVIEYCRREGYFYDCFVDSPKDWESLQAAIIWEDLRSGNEVSSRSAVKALQKVDRKKYDRISADFLFSGPPKQVSMAFLKDKIKLLEDRPWFDALKTDVEEAEYLRAALRRGEYLKKEPRIIVDTIHGAKGAERENVVLFSDVSRSTSKAAAVDPSAEARVFYVGATRAKERLYVVQPSTPYYFNLERT